jgi:selenocysteine-specific translation elongation factor
LDNEVITKTVRPPVALVTHKILAKLMISDPISLIDLAVYIVDATKEHIQLILDVLQILGIVMPLKKMDSSKETLAKVYYSLSEYCRVPCPVDISNIDADIIDKVESTLAVQSRLTTLHACLFVFY